MTALPSQTTFSTNATDVGALFRAEAATVDYCTSLTADLPRKVLRDLTPLEAMYAYFGSDEATT
ncbi:MAG: hypothetical protein ACK4GC_14760 [Paracoccaceae bacterium]